MQFAYDNLYWKQVFVISLYYILSALPALSLCFQKKEEEKQKQKIKKQIIMHEKKICSQI